MNPYVQIALQFVTVFLGAFLAVWLESYRERRQLKTWVKRYLEQMLNELHSYMPVYQEKIDHMQMNVDNLVLLIDARDESDLDGFEWKRLAASHLSDPSDLSPILATEAIHILPPELADALARLERADKTNAMMSSYVDQLRQRDILPLFFSQPWPLSEQERRQLGYFQETLSKWLELSIQHGRELHHCQAKLEEHLPRL